MQVEVNVIINKPPEEVFAFITNFENNALWQSGVMSAHFTSTGTLRVGSTYVQHSKFLGQQIEFAFEILEYEPGRHIRFKTTSGTFPVDIVRAVEPADGGTKLSAIITGEPGGIFRLAAPLVHSMMRRQIETDYANLKTLLEAG